MQNPIYKTIEYENQKLTENARKCNDCEERCSEYHEDWICIEDEQ